MVAQEDADAAGVKEAVAVTERSLAAIKACTGQATHTSIISSISSSISIIVSVNSSTVGSCLLIFRQEEEEELTEELYSPGSRRPPWARDEHKTDNKGADVAPVFAFILDEHVRRDQAATTIQVCLQCMHAKHQPAKCTGC